MEWWLTLLGQPEHLRTQVVPSNPPAPQPMAVSYTDACLYGPGGVLMLPGSRLAVFFRIWVPLGDLIDSLKVETAAVADATFAPIKAAHAITDEVTFVDNTVSLPWITSGCSNRPAVDEILAGLWLNLALCGWFKW